VESEILAKPAKCAAAAIKRSRDKSKPDLGDPPAIAASLSKLPDQFCSPDSLISGKETWQRFPANFF
jgi:hypothetical protein